MTHSTHPCGSFNGPYHCPEKKLQFHTKQQQLSSWLHISQFLNKRGNHKPKGCGKLKAETHLWFYFYHWHSGLMVPTLRLEKLRIWLKLLANGYCSLICDEHKAFYCTPLRLQSRKPSIEKLTVEQPKRMLLTWQPEMWKDPKMIFREGSPNNAWSEFKRAFAMKKQHSLTNMETDWISKQTPSRTSRLKVSPEFVAAVTGLLDHPGGCSSARTIVGSWPTGGPSTHFAFCPSKEHNFSFQPTTTHAIACYVCDNLAPCPLKMAWGSVYPCSDRKTLAVGRNTLECVFFP